ncbi:MAG: hypothetical protein Fur0042_13440 [Cyanophyceae cyanobacterium]
MVNVGFSWGSLIGIMLAVAGAALYFLRSVRPGLARDYDIFFAAVGLLCGGILFFNSWRLDPILQFSQFLLAGSTIFFAYESIRLRGVATEQAKRSAPPVSYEDDRPVSRVYRAELDELEPPPPPQPFLRRIRGTDDGAAAGPGDYGAYGGVEEGRGGRRRPPSGGSGGGRPVRSRPPVEGLGDEPPGRRPPSARPDGRSGGRPSRSPRSPLASDGWDQEDVTEMPPRSPSGRPARGPERGTPERGTPERGQRRSPAPQGDRSGGRPSRDRMERGADRSGPPRSPRVSLEEMGTPYLDEEEPPTRATTGRSGPPPPTAEEPYVDYQPIDPAADPAAVAPLDLDERPERQGGSERSPQAAGAGGRSLDLRTPPPERPPSERPSSGPPRSSRMASALEEDDYDEEYGDRYGDPYGDDEDDDERGDRRVASYGAGAYDDLDADDDLGDDFGRPPRDR